MVNIQSKKYYKEITTKSKQSKRSLKDYFAKFKPNTLENLDEQAIFEENVIYLN